MSDWNPQSVAPQLSPDPVDVPPLTHAISIKEPFGYLIASGWKSCEVRSVAFPRNRPLPAWVAIHASPSRDEITDDDQMLDIAALSDGIASVWSHKYWSDNPGHRLFGHSEIIGAMRVVASVPGASQTPEQLQLIRDAWSGRTERCRSDVDPRDWLSDEGWNWIIDDAYRFATPIVCKGALGIWQMRSELSRLVNEQMRQAVATGGIGREAAYRPATVWELPKGIDARVKKLYGCGAA